MVKFFKDRLEGGFYVAKVHHPARYWIRFTAHPNLNLERVTVHPPALVPFRDIG